MPDCGTRLDRAFFARSPDDVARSLVGCLLHTRIGNTHTSGRIVETEAYAGPDDPASHAARLAKGRTSMVGKPGFAYIYRSYGIHAMFNVVCQPEGQYGAVLVRAAEPLAGLDVMMSRRGVNRTTALCSGPGRLCQAMDIRLEHDGCDVIGGQEIWITLGEHPEQVYASGRIGISRGQERPWRFFDSQSLCVSASRRGARLVPMVGCWTEGAP